MAEMTVTAAGRRACPCAPNPGESIWFLAPSKTRICIDNANPTVGCRTIAKSIGAGTANAATPTPTPPAQTRNVKGGERLDLDSEAAKREIEKGWQYFESRGQSRADLEPRTVDVDELGMVHIRFNRTYQGVKMSPNQIILHFPKPGSADEPSTSGFAQTLPKGLLDGWTCTEQQAKDMVSAAIQASLSDENGKKAEVLSSRAERLLVADKAGVYAGGYRVNTLVKLSERIARLTFFVDGKSGTIALDD